MATIFRRAARAASDWIDLQWSLVVRALEAVAPRAHGKALDVGCGNKAFERIFRPVDAYFGIEHEATFYATAANLGPSRPDYFYDGKRLPFEDCSFDTVICIQVLEHTPQPRRLIVEMARVLKKDGALILAVPFSFRLHEEPHDYFGYSPHGLGELCRDAGLALQVARVGDVAQQPGKWATNPPSNRVRASGHCLSWPPPSSPSRPGPGSWTACSSKGRRVWDLWLWQSTTE